MAHEDAAAAKKTAEISDIDRERARVRRLLRGKAADMLSRRPPNGAWSIVENVQHLLFAEQLHLGRFVPGLAFSPLGMTGMKARRFAAVGTRAPRDIDEVFAEWDAAHRAIRKALRAADREAIEVALWRNHRHLRIHINLIERLLRTWSAGQAN
jgi:hypothetical protein